MNRDAEGGKTVTLAKVAWVLTPAWLTLCAGCGSDAITPGQVLVGSWGGQGVAVEATTDSAFVRFDCAYGSLVAPVVIDDQGRFSVHGEYVREVGPAALRDDARYEGRVSGATLELTVFVTDTLAEPELQVVGPFVAVRNREPQVYFCQ